MFSDILKWFANLFSYIFQTLLPFVLGFFKNIVFYFKDIVVSGISYLASRAMGFVGSILLAKISLLVFMVSLFSYLTFNILHYFMFDFTFEGMTISGWIMNLTNGLPYLDVILYFLDAFGFFVAFHILFIGFIISLHVRFVYNYLFK